LGFVIISTDDKDPGDGVLRTSNNMANRLISYFKESKEELKKVNWPTRKQTIKNTLIVIGVSVGVALFLGLVDYLLSFGLTRIIS